MTDEQIETALNACMFGQTKETRCKDFPLDSEKEPCITNLHLAALEYIRRLKYRAEVAERALRYACWDLTKCYGAKVRQEWADLKAAQYKNKAEKELAEEGKDD